MTFMTFLTSKCGWLIHEMVIQKYLLCEIQCTGEGHRQKEWYVLI